MCNLPLLFLISLSLAAQDKQKPATLDEFDAMLQCIIINDSQWRKAIEAVKVEGLSVSYAIGKRFEQSKSIVSDDLRVTIRFAELAKRDHSLFAEVNLLSAIQELQSQISNSQAC